MPELLLEHLGHALVVGARVVHLVDEGDARHAVALHLLVDGDRLALHALARVEHEDRAVEHAQRALHLDGEVDVAGGVDDVDVVVRELILRSVPDAVGRGGLDRDALLALEIHRVHLGADAVLAAHLVNLVDSTRVEQDALGERRLARVDVGGDADVADAVEGDACGQGMSLLLGFGRPDNTPRGLVATARRSNERNCAAPHLRRDPDTSGFRRPDRQPFSPRRGHGLLPQDLRRAHGSGDEPSQPRPSPQARRRDGLPPGTVGGRASGRRTDRGAHPGRRRGGGARDALLSPR